MQDFVICGYIKTVQMLNPHQHALLVNALGTCPLHCLAKAKVNWFSFQ